MKNLAEEDRTQSGISIQETFKCTSYHLSDHETSIQVLLKFQLIEKRNSSAHLSKCFAVWCRAKEGIKDGFFLR